MSDIPALLLASLNPETRKPAEQSLSALSAQQGFIPHLVQLFLDTTQDRAVRLAASVYLKNLVKLRWEEVSLRVNLITLFDLRTGCATAARG